MNSDRNLGLSSALLLCYLILSPSDSRAQDSFATIDSLLSHYEQQDAFNGSLLIADQGQIVYNRSIGYGDFQEKLKLDSKTPMPLSSITKTFTVMATMMLAERGLLTYNDKVRQHLPTIPYENMTLRHLMTSTSGLKRLYAKATLGDSIITIDDMITYLSKKEPRLSFKPGDKFQSSVVGYCLLAGVVEKVSGQSFAQFLSTEIFNKLRMENTFLLNNQSWAKPRAVSLDKNNKANEWFLGSYSGGIGIYASAEDLLKWDQAHYDQSLVSQESIRQAYRATSLNDSTTINYTLGWMRWRGNDNLIFKNGDWVANSSILFRDIEKNFTIIVLANRQNKVSKFDVMDIVLPLLGYPPSK